MIFNVTIAEIHRYIISNDNNEPFFDHSNNTQRMIPCSFNISPSPAMKILAVFIKLTSSSLIVYLSVPKKLIHSDAVRRIVTFFWCTLNNNYT